MQILSFITIIIVGGSVVYAWSAIDRNDAASGKTLTSTMMQGIIDRVDDALVPTGAVMAFNLAACPMGWSIFSSANGRTIVGVGSDGQGDTYTLLNMGGEARHTLSVSEMPSHSHSIATGDVYNTGVFVINDHSGDGIVSSDNMNPAYFEPKIGRYWTDPVGGSQPHESRMPYLALLYCMKN